METCALPKSASGGFPDIKHAFLAGVSYLVLQLASRSWLTEIIKAHDFFDVGTMLLRIWAK